MMEEGVGKRLDGERGSLSHRNMDYHDPAGAEIDHGRYIDLLSVLHAWTLKPHVTEVLVCNPRKNALLKVGMHSTDRQSSRAAAASSSRFPGRLAGEVRRKRLRTG
jgi:hypothetical protein